MKYDPLFQRTLKDIRWKANKLVSPVQLFKFSAVDAPPAKKQQMQEIGIIYFIYLFLYAGLEFTLPFLTHMRFGFDRQKRIAEIGIMCIVPAFLIVAQATNQFLLYLGLFLYAIASASVVSCLTSLVTTVDSSADKGALSGVFRSLGALARALGPVTASSLFWICGPTRCYTIGGILLLIPLMLLRRLENPIRESTKAE
ncbi:unnamed protein product [Heligmosomoides polygyrus]|uniref:MFS domain-containing protein n=1 Tax=Heligmosomoides polygyrus TaxID=6339 RepID=A0A183G1Q8_HELPZ|nr:unnamed protein product [Heligmosomoides polygyrus]